MSMKRVSGSGPLYAWLRDQSPCLRSYTPIRENVSVYEELYGLYRQLHDAFGISGKAVDLAPVMKRLLDIRDRVTAAA